MSVLAYFPFIPLSWDLTLEVSSPTLRGMAKYKLTYFDFSGSRGEECRLALFAAGADFEDNRIQRQQWAELKPASPFGGMPILEQQGKPPLSQSNAILAYVGRQYGLHPQDLWQAALHESVMIAAEDLRTTVNATRLIEDAEAKKKARQALAEGEMQAWGTRIEKHIQGPLLAGNELHVADIKVYQVIRAYKQGVIDDIPPTVFDGHQKLSALYDAVHNHPRIAEWRKRHEQ